MVFFLCSAKLINYQEYSIRNPKGPLAKFPYSPGSGTVTVKIPKHAQTVMWSGLIFVKGDTFFVV